MKICEHNANIGTESFEWLFEKQRTNLYKNKMFFKEMHGCIPTDAVVNGEIEWFELWNASLSAIFSELSSQWLFFVSQSEDLFGEKWSDLYVAPCVCINNTNLHCRDSWQFEFVT